MDWRVPLADLDYGEEENLAVLDVLKRRWLTMGEVTQRFEQQFAAAHGMKHALAVSNATVALHMACVALGIGPGDEVIAPSLSFVATTNAVLYTGAKVRFADILSEDELTIDPQEIERLVTPRTKAVILMHYAGYPCRMQQIMEIARRHDLAVIEDAAHAPGASLDGRWLGAWGDTGCFSFFSNKNLSTGEGGMIVTQRDEIAEKLRLLRSHGMTSLTWDRHKGHAYSYDVVSLGYNYRLDEIHSALGIAQLEKLVRNNERRRDITQAYWEAFKDSDLGLPFASWASQPGVQPAFHIFPILLPEGMQRMRFIDAMRQQGVQTSIHYPPIHRFRFYQEHYPGVVLAKTERVAAREVTLPLYPGMSQEQVEMVIKAVKQAV